MSRTSRIGDLVERYNTPNLKRYFIHETLLDGFGTKTPSYVVTDSLNKNESIVKVFVDKEECYSAVNKANDIYRDVFYSEAIK